jgi:YbbR domain-containing protein
MENKRYHIIIASIVFAVLMWFSINMGYEYTIVKHIPVILENRRDDRALRYPTPKSITVWFQGHGWQLAGLYFLPEIKYFIDLSSLTGDHFILTSRDFSEHVKIPPSIQPVDIKPETLVLAFDESREKKVPVIPRITISSPEGFGIVGPMKVTPESVLVSGSQHMIETVPAWSTEHLRFDNQRNPVDEQIGLVEPMNYAIDVTPRTVRLQIDIQPFAEKTFEGISLTVLGIPLNRDVIFIPPKMDVTARGSIDQLATLALENFQAKIDFQSLVEDSTGTVTPSLIVPEGVKIIHRSPERFQFIIRKKL